MDNLALSMTKRRVNALDLVLDVAVTFTLKRAKTVAQQYTLSEVNNFKKVTFSIT